MAVLNIAAALNRSLRLGGVKAVVHRLEQALEALSHVSHFEKIKPVAAARVCVFKHPQPQLVGVKHRPGPFSEFVALFEFSHKGGVLKKFLPRSKN